VEANRLPGWKSKLLDLSGLVGGVLLSLLHQTPEVDACSHIPHFDLATGYKYFYPIWSIVVLRSCRPPGIHKADPVLLANKAE